MSLEVRRPRDEEELAAAIALRQEVFCGEQGVPVEAELDERDAEAIHLVAVDEDGTVVGTCRLLTEPDGSARFGRLCVAAAARRRGAGSALLTEAEREARACGARRIGMHAQTDALALYRHAGYTLYGEPFEEEGIEHVGMEKMLA